jgi:hypothetical protein
MTYSLRASAPSLIAGLIGVMAPIALVFSSPADATPISTVKSASQSIAVDAAADSGSGCSADAAHAVSGLTVNVTPTTAGEEREVEGTVKIHLTSGTNGGQAMACVTVKCEDAAFGPGGPDNAQTVSNVVEGQASREYKVRALVGFPTSGHTYTCSVFLSGESTSGVTGSIVLDYMDSARQYGILTASSAVDPTWSEHCYHTTAVRTSDCYDNWANYGIDSAGNQGIVADDASSISHRTDTKLDDVPVGSILTLKATVYVTTCNVSGYLACPSTLGSGSASLTTSLKQLATGCTVALTLPTSDPDYATYNGTDSGTVTMAQHHGVVLAQKKLTVTGYTAGSTSCSLKIWSETTTSGRSVNVHGMHTRLYTLS